MAAAGVWKHSNDPFTKGGTAIAVARTYMGPRGSVGIRSVAGVAEIKRPAVDDAMRRGDGAIAIHHTGARADARCFTRPLLCCRGCCLLCGRAGCCCGCCLLDALLHAGHDVCTSSV